MGCAIADALAAMGGFQNDAAVTVFDGRGIGSTDFYVGQIFDGAVRKPQAIAAPGSNLNWQFKAALVSVATIPMVEWMWHAAQAEWK